MRPHPAYKVTYLELAKPPSDLNFQPALNVISASPIPPAYFRSIYSEVGRKWLWEDLLEEPVEVFQAYCNQKSKRIYTLIHNGAPAGFFVLHQMKQTTDLAYFGLLEDVFGQGLGKQLLDYAIHEAWKSQTCKKMTVNTCTLDHPSALPLYKSRGFVESRTELRPASRHKFK